MKVTLNNYGRIWIEFSLSPYAAIVLDEYKMTLCFDSRSRHLEKKYLMNKAKQLGLSSRLKITEMRVVGTYTTTTPIAVIRYELSNNRFYESMRLCTVV